jgi:hypothetical protein
MCIQQENIKYLLVTQFKRQTHLFYPTQEGKESHFLFALKKYIKKMY